MATATVALTVNAHPYGVDNTQRRQILDGIAALSGGGTYATNGLPFTWSFVNAEGGAFIPNFSTLIPVFAEFFTKAGGLYVYWYDTVHNTLRISLAGVELANGAAITADTIAFHAEFPRGV
jgi:predicted permease